MEATIPQLRPSTACRDAGSAPAPAPERSRLTLGILDAIHDGVFIFDHETLRFSHVNQGATQQTGYSREELLAMTAADIKPLFDEASFREMIAPAIAGDVAEVMFETVYRCKDGSDVPVEVVLQFVHAGDEPGCFIAVVRDITERKRAEESLRESERRYRQLVHTLPAAIYTCDAEGRITLYNEAAAIMWGRKPEPGTDLWCGSWRIYEPDGRPLPLDECPMALALREGRAIRNREIVVERPDGARFDVLPHPTPLRDASGAVIGAVNMLVDITERKKLGEQLRRTQRLEGIGTLASGVAHDLNNILAPILMSVPMLEQALAGTPSAGIVDIVVQCAERGAGIVRQVLTFARGVEGARMTVQVGHLLRDILKIATETFPRSITIRNSTPPDLWPANADATQLHQVLLNLCVNARDAMPDGGTLTITAANLQIDESYAAMSLNAKAGPYLMLSVADTGDGIPAAIVQKIFDPFFTTKEIGKGTGLGLSTVNGIVKSHGGFITVESEPGHGSTFTVFLPAEPDAAGLPETELAANLPRGNGELILLVDDEASVRSITQAVLVAHGYRVLLEADGIEGLATFALQSADIALVLTDIAMPVMDGIALTCALRRMKPDLRVIVSTGHGEKAFVSGLAVGTFLHKPYDAGTLLRRLHAVLNEPIAAAA